MADSEQLNPKDDFLCLIYERSQESAEHHDTLLWEVTYIIWGSTTLLLGFVLEAIDQQPFLALMTAVLSVFLSIMVLRFATLYRGIRNKKYSICKDIETAMPERWRQHSLTGNYSPGEQTTWYWVTTFVFIIVWLAVAAKSAYLMCGCKLH